MNKYNINHWDSIINNDLILEEYHKQKTLILDYLYTQPDELVKHIWHDMLTIDHDCRVKINQGDLDSEFICINCKNMQLFIIDNPIGEPFKVLTGDLTDQSMIITETKVTVPQLQWINKNTIKGDQFTMKILLTWYMEDLFVKLGIPSILLYCAFICHDSGFLLYKVPTVNNELCTFEKLLDTLDEEILIKHIDGLMMQFIVIFDILKNNNVCLGQPNITSFLVSDKPCDYEYKNHTVKCDYTVYLSNLSGSHVKINNIEFSSKTSNQLMIDKFANKLCQLKKDCYKINNYDCNLKHKYPASLDFYLFLSSLLETPYVYHIMKSNENAFNMWKKCWCNYDDVMGKLKERYENEQEFDAYDILDTWLFTNPIEQL